MPGDGADELRALFTVIQGYAELLADGQVADELQVRASAREILASAQQMQRLLDNPTETLVLRRVELVEWLSEVIETFARRSPSHQVAVDLPRSLPPVRIDRHQLGQVVERLLADAARCCEPGSLIVVTAHVFAAGTVEIQVVDQGAAARQAESVLAEVRRVVEAHAGEIGVRSTPGRGCTVWLRLPSEVRALAVEPPVWIDAGALVA